MQLQSSLFSAHDNAKFIDCDTTRTEALQNQKLPHLFHCIFQKYLCCFFPAPSAQGAAQDMRLPTNAGQLEKLGQVLQSPDSAPTTQNLEKQLKTLLSQTESIKKYKEFNQPQLAIDDLLALKPKLEALKNFAKEVDSANITALQRLIEINIARGLMNAYRFTSLHQTTRPEEHKVLQVAAFHHAMALQAMLPNDLDDVLSWLQQTDPSHSNDFFAILCNDLGKFLKDTDTTSLGGSLSNTERYHQAIMLLKKAIATAPEHTPAIIFAREACVDAMIKLRREEQSDTKRTPLSDLFTPCEQRQMRSWLRAVIQQSESLGNTHWQAYKSAQTQLRQLSSMAS